MQRDLLVVRALRGGKMFVDLADHEMHGRQRFDVAVSQVVHAPPSNLDFVARDGFGFCSARHDRDGSTGWTYHGARFWRLDGGDGSRVSVHVLLPTLALGNELRRQVWQAFTGSKDLAAGDRLSSTLPV
ncbi:MAG: hypothetical protein ACREED_09315 [Stellaceae bacterium]